MLEIAKDSLVGLIMGSKSDFPVAHEGMNVLTRIGIPFDTKIISAHRTPELVLEYARAAEEANVEAIIALAGGSAQLPGDIASKTRIFVIGVPIATRYLNGIDSSHSMNSMPPGINLLCAPINGSINAALSASQVVANKHPEYWEKFMEERERSRREVYEQNEELAQLGPEGFFNKYFKESKQ